MVCLVVITSTRVKNTFVQMTETFVQMSNTFTQMTHFFTKITQNATFHDNVPYTSHLALSKSLG